MSIARTPSILAALSVFVGACGHDSGLKIHEEPPTAAVLDPGENDSFVEGLPVAFRVRLDDNDDGFAALDVAWRSDTMGTLRGETSMDGNVQTFVTTDLELGTHVVTVTATDPDGQVATDDVQVLVVENSTPVVSIVSPGDDSAYGEAEDVVIVAEVDDQEEDPDALGLRWTVGTNPDLTAPDRAEPDGLSMHVVSGLPFGTHAITVDVTDSLGQQSSASINIRVVPEDGDGDGITTGELGGEDCDDTNPDIGPGATEVCDGVDNDCDGLIDADDPDIADPIEGHPDNDGDGYGDSSTTIVTCDLADLSEEGGDCNDGDPMTNPGAMEVCGDGLDNDCDGTAGACAWSGDIMIDEADFIAFGDAGSDRLASAIAGADVNGDGSTDLIIAARDSNRGASDGGAVYIIEGPIVPTVGPVSSLSDTIIDGTYELGFAGEALSTLDFDGDGADDIVIGAPRVDSLSSEARNAGEVHIFYGEVSADGETAEADLAIYGTRVGQRFGQSTDAGGDIDGDGLPDLVIGAPRTGTHAYRAGGLSIFTGLETRVTGLLSADDRDGGLISTEDRMLFGTTVRFIGDTNGDGRDDLLVGAPGTDENGDDSGAALLFLGHPTLFSTGIDRLETASDAAYLGTRAGDKAGLSLTALDDVDGDGYTEFAIAAPYNDTGWSNAGATYLMIDPDRTGTHNLDDVSDEVLYGSSPGMQAGESLAGSIDLNNDGVLDLVIGAPNAEVSIYSQGTSFIIYGPLDEVTSGPLRGEGALTDATIIGEAPFNYAGKAMLGGHDWTGDGVTDLAMSAPGNDYDTGALYLFFGRGL